MNRNVLLHRRQAVHQTITTCGAMDTAGFYCRPRQAVATLHGVPLSWGTCMTAFRILSALAAFALFPWAILAQTGGVDPKAFVGFRLVDVDRGAVVEDAAMVVRGGRIEAIGRRRSVTLPAVVAPVDLKGAYVIPGLISTHVHVSDVDGDRPRAYTAVNTTRQLRVFARYGVTTVLSLDGEREPAFAARDAQAVPSLDRARLFVSGSAIVGKTPEDARQMVATVAALRPDIIKIRVDDNLGTTAKMGPEVYRAVIDEAHRRGLRVAAHLFYLDDAKALLRAGVDLIAHSVQRPRNRRRVHQADEGAKRAVLSDVDARSLDVHLRVDAGVLRRSLLPERSGSRRCRTVAGAGTAEGDAGDPPARSATRRRSPSRDAISKRASKAGLLVAMGTDAGPFPERFQGYFEHLELGDDGGVRAHAGRRCCARRRRMRHARSRWAESGRWSGAPGRTSWRSIEIRWRTSAIRDR